MQIELRLPERIAAFEIPERASRGLPSGKLIVYVGICALEGCREPFLKRSAQDLRRFCCDAHKDKWHYLAKED